MKKKTENEALIIRAKINDITRGRLNNTTRMELHDLVQQLVKLFDVGKGINWRDVIIGFMAGVFGCIIMIAKLLQT